MSGGPRDLRAELERLRRVADQSCTAHSLLVGRYTWFNTILDLAVLGVSLWLVAVAFIDPDLSKYLTPPGIEERIWLGLLATGTFFLVVIQLRVDWRARAEAHGRTLDMYAQVKADAAYALADEKPIDADTFHRISTRYDLAAVVGKGIPDSEFLRLKREHKLKVAISRHLDTHPGAPVWLTRLLLVWRDSFGGERAAGEKK